MAQRAEPAQHRRDERPHQRAVALGKRGKARMRGRRRRAARRARGGGAARRRRCRRRCAGPRGPVRRRHRAAARGAVFAWPHPAVLGTVRRHRASRLAVGRTATPREHRWHPTQQSTDASRKRSGAGQRRRQSARCRRRPNARSPRPRPAAPNAPHRARSAEGNRRPRRPRADPLRRLGSERPGFGFLGSGSGIRGQA